MADLYDKHFDDLVNLAGVGINVEVSEKDIDAHGVDREKLLEALTQRISDYFSPAIVHVKTTTFDPSPSITGWSNHDTRVMTAVAMAIDTWLPQWIEEAAGKAAGP